MNVINIRILTPLPAEVCPELLKKHNIPFPITKWLGENDLEKFETWIYDLVSWLSSSRWKGPAYNEQQVSTLMQMLEGEPKLIMIHDNKEGYERGHEVLFLEHLTKLMHMYIKRLAAVPSTKLFKTLSYDSSKGIKSFYTQLLHVSEKMITCPDQATFNECFINTLPSHFKEELVMCDKISVNFSSREELWQAVLQLDHAYDSLRVINAYRSANHYKVSHSPSNLANKSLNQTGQLASTDKQNNLHYSKFNNNKNNNKPPMWTNRLPGANEYKKPAAPTANSSYKRDDKGPNALKPPFHPTVNPNYQNHPSADKTGNPIYYRCGKIGYTNECPNHPQQTKVFAM